MKKTTLTILCVALVFAMAGCASNTGTQLPTPSPMSPTMMPANTMAPSMSTLPGGSPLPDATGQPEAANMMTSEEAAAAAKRISDEVIKLSEVDKATTVVMGSTALVGVNFTAQYKGEMTTRIKDMVSERAKKAAPAIQQVAVSADPDLITRIQALMTKVQNGANATEISTEFSEIVNRVAPM